MTIAVLVLNEFSNHPKYVSRLRINIEPVVPFTGP